MIHSLQKYDIPIVIKHYNKFIHLKPVNLQFRYKYYTKSNIRNTTETWLDNSYINMNYFL